MASENQVSKITGADRILARAFFLAERIHVRSLEHEELLAKLPLMMRSGDGGYVVVFRYGAIVFFNVSPERENAILEKIRPLLVQPFEDPSTEQEQIRIRSGVPEEVLQEGMVLSQASVPRLQLVAEILAKSLVLEHYEQRVSRNLELLEPIMVRLRVKGLRSLKTRHLLHQIVDSLMSLHRMVGVVEVAEKPDLLWDHPELERLYVRMEEEYEIPERQRALERKVELVFRTADTLQDLLQTKRTLRVEWYIVMLIIVEIIIIVYEIFFMH